MGTIIRVCGVLLLVYALLYVVVLVVKFVLILRACSRDDKSFF